MSDDAERKNKEREIKELEARFRKFVKDNPSISIPPQIVDIRNALAKFKSDRQDRLHELMFEMLQSIQLIREKLPAKLAAMPDDQLTDSLKWAMAVASWDYRDDRLLSMLLRQRPVPMEIQEVLADIISQRRQQKRLSHSKLSGFTRALVSQAMWIDQQFNAVARRQCEPFGDELQLTPTEAIAAINTQQNELKSFVCRLTDLSDDGLEKLRKEFERYLKIFD